MTPSLAALVAGFLMGMRHALDPDHLVTVTTLSCVRDNQPRLIFHGIVWGLGHAATLFLVSAATIFAGESLPPAVNRPLEAGVALLLIALGASAVWQVGSRHVRHSLRQQVAPLPRHRGFKRTFAVGLAQGMSGSATLLLLAISTVRSPWLAICYVVCFGIGSIVGMGAVAATIVVPLGRASSQRAGLIPLVSACAGGATLAVGLMSLWELRLA